MKPLSHLAGDLALLAVMMGKDNFSSTWCCWCRLTKAAWQESGCELNDTDLWDLVSIIAQVKWNEENGLGHNKGTDVRMKGVR